MKKFLKYSARNIAAVFLRAYQRTVSPDHGIGFFAFGTSRCRFFPSCSEYALRAIRQYGLFPGSMVSLKRIFRCNPWNPGGYDPLPSSNNESFTNLRINEYS